MIIEESAVVFFSWEEFGQIVETLADEIEDSVLCDGLVCLDERARILVISLSYRLGVPVLKYKKENSLTVDLDNLRQDPHVAVTYFQNSDTDHFELKEPRFHYRDTVIDTEGRKQEVLFPWQKI